MLLLTSNSTGYIYYSKDKQQCMLDSRSKSSETGMWGESIRQKKPIIINKITEGNQIKNLSSFALNRLISIPISSENTIVASTRVAHNLQINLFMTSDWKAVAARNAEAELKSGIEKLRPIFDLSPIGTAIVTPVVVIMNSNRAFSNFIGYSTEELVGMFYNTIKFPIIQPGKEAILAGFTIDITENRFAEKAIQKAADDWQTTLNETNDAIFLIDVDNRIQRANKTAASMFWRDNEQLRPIGSDNSRSDY